MIKFFRHIRQRMLTENPPLNSQIRAGKLSKYLLYAIGEIILVVIGILIALQINTWNEERKQHTKVVELYSNLLESLSADSADLVRVLKLHDNGMRAQRYIMSNSYQELVESNTLEAIRDTIEQTTWVASSLFPRNSVYNQITNNGYTALLRSEEIKGKLLELYDRRYPRYLHIDASIDQKSEFHLEPIIGGDLLILHYAYDIQSMDSFNLARLEVHYPALRRECNSIYSTATYANGALRKCEETIHELLHLIREELAPSNP